MIPILYESNETEYLTNGIGRLSSAISVTATEDNSGYDEIEVKYPILGEHYRDIDLDKIILVKPAQNRRTQPYYVYNISRPINGIVTINARHISYKLAGMVVMPYSAGSCYEALTAIPDHTVEECPFAFDTDKAVTGAFSITEPTPVRTILGGSAGSILDVYGKGQYEFDRFSVYLHVNRGQDRGVTLRYGKNLTDLTRKTDTSSVYVGIVPYWSDSEGNVVTLPEQVLYSTAASSYAYKTVKVVDLSSEFDEQPTEGQLRQRAQTYLDSNEGWEIADNITVSFAALWQTEEYKDVAPLQEVGMGDTVTVIDSRLGVKASAKVIKTVYNVLEERYDKIELGTAKNSLATVIAESSVARVIEPWVNQKFEVMDGRFTSMIEQKTQEIDSNVDLLVNQPWAANIIVPWEASDADKVYWTTYDSKQCLCMDGTDVEEYGLWRGAYTVFNPDLTRPASLSITIDFDYAFEPAITDLPTQRYIGIAYRNIADRHYYWTGVNMSGSGTGAWKHFTSTNRIKAYASDWCGLSLNFIPGHKCYFANVRVYVTLQNYEMRQSSYINQTASEIELSVSELKIHNYIAPFTDIKDGNYSWGSNSGFESDGYVLSTGTYQGHECIIIDGTDATEQGFFAYTERWVDYVDPTMKLAVTYDSSANIPAGSGYYIAGSSFPTGGGSFVSTSTPAMAHTAGTPAALNVTYAMPSDVDFSEQWRPTVRLYGYPGMILYFWNGTIETTVQKYNEAVMTITSEGINSKVAKDGVISSINQSAEAVTINASKINLTGDLSLRGDFHSYDLTDSTIYAYLNAGSLSFYNSTGELFRIGPGPQTGVMPGIFFGNSEDPTSLSRYTRINRDTVRTAGLYIRSDGSQYADDFTGIRNEGGLSVWGSSNFYGLFYLRNTGYTSSGAVITSDRRKKKSIKDIARSAARTFINALRPRVFKYNDGTSGRDHHGFIAQELQEAMDGVDWGVLVTDPDGYYGLRHEEIIADLVSVVQQHEEEIAALREKLAAMEGDK